MKKILAILIALLAALSAQTVAFADGEMMPLQPAQTESIADGNSVELNDDLTDSQGIKYRLNENDQTAIVSGHTDTLSKVITIPATVTKDGVKYTVTSIGDYAFWNCSGLTSVDIPDSVTSIGDYAFQICTSLSSITFAGINPPSFGPTAFDHCKNLQTISLSADMTQEQQAAWKSALNAAGLDNKDIQFTGNLISEPTPTPDPTPTTPPADNNTAAEAASTPTVQQMEAAERPDPQDVEATERYNFWMDVKADLRAAADGKTLRVHVPADYTNMPAIVMEQIRLLDADVTVDLRWSGERLAITPATAQRKTALKAFWTFSQLCELYAQ